MSDEESGDDPHISGLDRIGDAARPRRPVPTPPTLAVTSRSDTTSRRYAMRYTSVPLLAASMLVWPATAAADNYATQSGKVLCAVTTDSTLPPGDHVVCSRQLRASAAAWCSRCNRRRWRIPLGSREPQRLQPDDHHDLRPDLSPRELDDLRRRDRHQVRQRPHRPRDVRQHRERLRILRRLTQKDPTLAGGNRLVRRGSSARANLPSGNLELASRGPVFIASPSGRPQGGDVLSGIQPVPTVKAWAHV